MSKAHAVMNAEAEALFKCEFRRYIDRTIIVESNKANFEQRIEVSDSERL